MSEKTNNQPELDSYKNLVWYIKLRWVILLGLTFVAVVQHYLIFQNLRNLISAFTYLGIFALFNLLLVFWVSKIRADDKKLSITASVLLYLDLLVALGAIMLSGGVDASIIYIPFVFLIATVLKDLRFGYAFMAWSIFLYVSAVLLDYFGLLPIHGPYVAARHEISHVFPALVYQSVLLYIYVFVYSHVVHLKDEREYQLLVQAKEIKRQTKLLEQQNRALKEEQALTDQANATLRKKLEELERVYRFTVGREKRIIELKKEVAKAKEKN